MRKLIAIAEHLLGEENNFANDAILLQPGSDEFISGGEILVNLREGLAEARHTIDGLESGWAAYEKARMGKPKSQWNLALWYLLDSQPGFTYFPSDIGNLGLHVDNDNSKDWSVEGTYRVEFGLKDLTIGHKFIWVTVPTTIWNHSVIKVGVPLIIKAAICKTLCEQFGNIDVLSIEEQ